MASIVSAKWDKTGLHALEPGPYKRAAVRALRKAGGTALRDMRSEAKKRITQRKWIKGKYISHAISIRSATGSDKSARRVLRAAAGPVEAPPPARA